MIIDLTRTGASAQDVIAAAPRIFGRPEAAGVERDLFGDPADYESARRRELALLEAVESELAAQLGVTTRIDRRSLAIAASRAPRSGPSRSHRLARWVVSAKASGLFRQPPTTPVSTLRIFSSTTRALACTSPSTFRGRCEFAPVRRAWALRLVDGPSSDVERSGAQRDAAEPLQVVADSVAAKLLATLAMRRTGADAKALRHVLRRIEELLDE